MLEIQWKDYYNNCNFHYLFNIEHFITNRTLADFQKLVKIIVLSGDLDKLSELSDLMITLRMQLHENKQVTRWKKDYDHLQKVRERYE